MSLLRDIQEDATSNETPVTALLRRCMILAGRLRHEPLKQWTRLETSGYPKGVALPPYRPKIQTQVLGYFAGYGSTMSNQSLPRANVPEEYRDWLFSAEIRQGVAEIEGLVASGEPQFHVPWPADVIALLQGKFIKDMALMDANQIVPATALQGALSGIRDRIVQFALEIEELDPSAGEAAPGESPIEQVRLTQIFNQTFHGENTAFAAGHSVYQAQTIKVDLSVVRELADTFEIPLEEREKLVAALSEDGGVAGPRTIAWIERLKAGAVTIGSGVATQTAIAALLGVLGIR